MSESFRLPTYANECFYVVVPGCDVFIPNGPIDTNSFFDVSFKIQVRQTIGLLAPHQRTPANVIASNPVEWLYFGVGVFQIIHPPVFVGLVNPISTRLDGEKLQLSIR